MVTLFLTCGLPGSGKTTRARQLERERGALRLTADEWLVALFGPSYAPPEVQRGAPDPQRVAVEALQWQVAERALALGVDVVLDWGVWSRAERDELRAKAAALGARVELHFLDAPLEELRRRLAARSAELGERTLHVDLDSLELWVTWLDRPGADELSVSVELATPEDVAALPAVERDASTLFSEWPEPLALPNELTEPEEFAEAQRAGRLWVARAASGDIAGFAQGDLVGGEPHLEELDVARAYGRIGIGRRLLEAVRAWARAQGHASLTLTTFRDLPWNAPFYARCGFRVLAPEELTPALRALVDDETARGLDPKQRVVMRCAV